MIIWFEKHSTISWIITLIIAVIIFYFSSKPLPFGSTQTTNILSILYHFLVFFYLSFFLLISLIKGDSRNRNFLIFGVILAFLYGVLDEVHQYFVPGRASAISDVLINSAGILFAGVLYSIRCTENKKDKIIF